MNDKKPVGITYPELMARVAYKSDKFEEAAKNMKIAFSSFMEDFDLLYRRTNNGDAPPKYNPAKDE